MYVENEPKQPVTAKDTSYASIIHLSSFVGFLIPFGGTLAPLILWLSRRKEDAFVDKHGKACLNFEVSLLLYFTIIMIFTIIAIIVGVGSLAVSNSLENYISLNSDDFLISGILGFGGFFFVSFILLVLYIVVKIIAAVKASNGEDYKYPLAISFFK